MRRGSFPLLNNNIAGENVPVVVLHLSRGELYIGLDSPICNR